MKHNLQIFLLSLGLLLSANAQAVDPTYTEFFSDKAIRGYDTVAYFTVGRAVKGDEAYQAKYNDATWLFSSAENLALFSANPSQYAPQFGGYCAYAVANNTTASIKPELFTIHEGKLYLNYSKSVNEKWLSDKVNLIDRANRNWPSLLAD
ncbi:YHS domain-containing (seleno)protein [Arenicella xantha]|uniref:YHS domain-containing protein n=1 Tax=Arenicella xantha TaxID=644221 RepID=A0A395JLB1_9GAMM|nr:YHS domain-containing (seleno)protein [Arenicella xantha]RBP51389.1 YHS domain-containing protein [Arenicella xantha]